MANDIPSPRSRQQIIGDMLDSITASIGISSLKVGGPILSILEAAAQSDVRNAQDIFQMLNSSSLDSAEGIALDRIGNSENIPRLTQARAVGVVDISDSSFTKKVSKLSYAKPAPIVGSSLIYVDDATDWPADGGEVYIGRGTSTVEGPIDYWTATDSGTYWTIELDSTTLFHNRGDTVTLAQGGDRFVGAGTAVSTPQSATSTAVEFKTSFPVTILDGETEVVDVQVIAADPGALGNVPAKGVSTFSGSGPFTGATVNNALPFVNGRDTESDNDYRNRIRSVRAAKTRGTDLAIKNAALGVVSTTENKSVSSASVVRKRNQFSNLYIDDGTGYEEQADGVGVEIVVDSANGGEVDFQTIYRPIAKAYLVSANASPYLMVEGAKLAVEIGGVEYVHTFHTAEFKSSEAASAYEVVASINADAGIQFSARTAESGNKVIIQARVETHEDIVVKAVASPDSDANDTLAFPASKAWTMSLYKNDRPLSKDGSTASVESLSFGGWRSLSGSQTLTIGIDRSAASQVTISDQDFVDSGCGYNVVSNATLAAWATVLSYKIPGITATAESGVLVLSSNLNDSSESRIEIVSGTLVDNLVFEVQTVYGSNKDYTVDRSTGQIFLEEPLVALDRLTVGSTYARAFLESANVTDISVAADRSMWWAVDGETTMVNSGVTAGTTLTGSIVKVTDHGYHAQISTDDAVAVFDDLESGDWAVFGDSVLSGEWLNNAWRVSSINSVASSNRFQIGKKSLNCPRGGAPLVAFDDGRAMIVGGYTSVYAKTKHDGATIPEMVNFVYGGCHTATCEIFDPTTGTWAYTAPMPASRVGHTATYSASRDAVVVAGGVDSKGTSLDTIIYYSIDDDEWYTETGVVLAHPRAFHTATLLADDTILFTGGINLTTGSSGTVIQYSELLKADDSEVETPLLMTYAQYCHRAVLVPATASHRANNVIVAGGYSDYAGTKIKSVAEYDYAGKSWTGRNAMANVRASFGLVYLNPAGDDKLMAIGDRWVTSSANNFGIELFDLNAGTWASGASFASSFSGAEDVVVSSSGTDAFVGYVPKASGSTLSHWKLSGATWTELDPSLYRFCSTRKVDAGVCTLSTGEILIAGGVNASNGEGYWSRTTASCEMIDDFTGTEAWSYPDEASDLDLSLPDVGLKFCRTDGILRETAIPTGSNYAISDYVSLIGDSLEGASCYVYRTNKIRVQTNSFEIGKDIVLVSSDATEIPITAGEPVVNVVGHQASVESGSGVGTPEDFRVFNIAYSVPADRQVVLADSVSVYSNKLPSITSQFLGLKRPISARNPYTYTHSALDGYETIEYSNSAGYVGEISNISIDDAQFPVYGNANSISVTVAEGRDHHQQHLAHEPVVFPHSFAVAHDDTLNVVIDGDLEAKNFTIPMSRKLTYVSPSYTTSQVKFDDGDNGDARLAKTFDLDYDFSGFELHTRAKCVTNAATSTSALLWRYFRYGAEGNNCVLRLLYPEGPDADVAVDVSYGYTSAVTTTLDRKQATNINVHLNSGSLYTGNKLNTTAKLGLSAWDSDFGGAPLLFLTSGYTLNQAKRTGSPVVNTFTFFRPTYDSKYASTSGLYIGQTLWFEAVNPSATTWYSGSFTITGVFEDEDISEATVAGSTRITFDGAELNDGTDPTVSITDIEGTISFDPFGEMTFDPAIEADDYCYITGGITGILAIPQDFSSAEDVVGKIVDRGKQYIVYMGPFAGYTTAFPAVDATNYPGETWVTAEMNKTTLSTALGSLDNIQIFGKSTKTAAEVAADVNALAEADDSTCPVTCSVVDVGGDVLNSATWEETSGNYVWEPAYFADGVNLVKSVHSYPVNSNGYFTFDLGRALDPTLSTLAASHNWFTNETYYLVPSTVRTVAKWMNTLCVTGLSSAAETAPSSGGRNLQIASLTPGTAGSVQVMGGTSNTATASAKGSAVKYLDHHESTLSTALTTISTSEVDGFSGGKWVRIDNTVENSKPTDPLFVSGSCHATVSSAGVFTFSARFDLTEITGASLTNARVLVEKVGDFVALHFPRECNVAVPRIRDGYFISSGLYEGCYIYLYTRTSDDSDLSAMSDANKGVFKVVRATESCDAVTIWIENSAAVDEMSVCNVKGLPPGSPIPGDVLVIQGTQFGSGNTGEWVITEVATVGGVMYDAAGTTISVNALETPMTTWATPTDASYITLRSGSPARLYKKVLTIAPNQTDGSYSDMALDGGDEYELINENLGSVITALDKLSFPTYEYLGVDGYKHSTGLIEEVNRVVYGDPADPTTYPGYAATGATVIVSGPLVRRISLALSLRVNSGQASEDLADRVRSAVASVVNQAGVGVSVSLSSIVTAASEIPGVIAVAMVSPTYTSSSDIISIGSSEKPMILDLTNDISISFVGV